MSSLRYDSLRSVQLVVTIWVDPDADISAVVSEMDYSFNHADIHDTEICDIITDI